MHDAGGVRGSDGIGHLHRDGQHLAQRHPMPAEVGKRLALHAFHGDEIHPGIVARFVDRDDVGVVERAGGLCFTQQASAAGCAVKFVGGEYLQGDRAIEKRVERLVDRAHAARTQFVLDFVVP